MPKNPLQLLTRNNLTVEDKIRLRGAETLRTVFEDQRDKGFEMQQKFRTLPNEGILTSPIPLHAQLPQKFRERLQGFRNRVKEVFFETARQIQEHRFEKSFEDIDTRGLAPFEKRRATAIVQGQQEFYISYDAVNEALRYFMTFNDEVIRGVSQTAGARKMDFYLLNGIIVYELTDAVIEIIRDFHARGKDTLKSINDQVSKDMEKQELADDQLRQRALALGPKGASYLHMIEERRRIRALVVRKWELIWKEVADLEAKIFAVRGSLDELEVNRDNARAQINTLEILGIMQITESNLKQLQEICAVTDIKLAPLTAGDACELLGLPDTYDTLPCKRGVSIISKASRKALDWPAANQPGAKLQQWDFGGGDNQIWVMENVGKHFAIVSKATDMCLEVDGASANAGAQITQGRFQRKAHQLWKIDRDGEGFCTIVSKSSGKALDVAGYSFDDGVVIHQWDTHGGDNQKWWIEAIKG